MMRRQPFWVMGYDAQPPNGVAPHPIGGYRMQAVIGIEQRDQDIDVEQRSHQ